LVTLAFFSVSESKLAPYILPMMPALAAIVGARVAYTSQGFLRSMAHVTGGLLAFLAMGFVVYAVRKFGFLPHDAMPWVVAGGVAGLSSLVVTWKRDTPVASVAWVAAACAILGWQCLLSAYSELPERSSYKLVMSVKRAIGPQTQLFSIGQYRETISPYLQRTLTLVDFEGELAFGLGEEPAAALSNEAFLARWSTATDAVAFIAPGIFADWQTRGLQGRVIGGDNRTLVISRL
jgi:4-amino-4-deoxy-L-arabinose transferase-like glycosyltransferase